MKNFPEIILASGSPRRAALLKQMGIPFQTVITNISEESKDSDIPQEFVKKISQRKAEAAAKTVSSGLIIAADTIVYLENKILGKPGTPEEAAAMLKRLSGNTHEVFTGFFLLNKEGGSYVDFEKTSVTFRQLEHWEIEAYVKTGRPMDKAGAYGIQDQSGFFIEKIEGCFYNVVGFPITKFYESLKQFIDTETLKKQLYFPDPGL